MSRSNYVISKALTVGGKKKKNAGYNQQWNSTARLKLIQLKEWRF